MLRRQKEASRDLRWKKKSTKNKRENELRIKTASIKVKVKKRKRKIRERALPSLASLDTSDQLPARHSQTTQQIKIYGWVWGNTCNPSFSHFFFPFINSFNTLLCSNFSGLSIHSNRHWDQEERKVVTKMKKKTKNKKPWFRTSKGL